MSDAPRWCVQKLQERSVARLAELLHEDRVPPIHGRLPSSISNAILDSLRRQKLARPSTLSRLTHHEFYLTEVNVSNCDCDETALRTLAQHRIESLSLYRTYNSKGDEPRSLLQKVVQELPPHAGCSSTLRSLNLGGCTLIGPFPYLPTIACFPGLESLFLNEVHSLANSDLQQICESLPSIRHLDISNAPNLTSISCLRRLRSLEVLLMHGIRLDMEASEVAETFRALSLIRVVDLSDKRSDYLSDSTDERPRVDLGLVLLDALEKDGRPFWPELRCLDLAGNPLGGLPLEIVTHRVRQLVHSHPHLVNLSLLDTPLDRLSFLEHPRSQLRVGNGATRAHSLHALSLYCRPERDAFTAHALQAVYYLLQTGYDSFGEDEITVCAELVERAMRCHPANLPIQMAASACLYQLCKVKRIKRLHARHIRLCVDRCLDAAQAFPTMTQLQKNVWLTICNDHLLQTPHIDFYRTCSVALESMLTNREASVSRMTIAIVSIVAPKVSASDSHLLASDSRYVAFLVDTIRQHIEENNAGHFTLKFTLSALWNLTDECAATCSQLVMHGGVDLAFRLLSQAGDQQGIRTKVLGLLNNLAEVPSLQKHLCRSDYIHELLDLLLSEPVRENADSPPRIDQQYFAAGILSNLLASSEEWKDCDMSKEEINTKLLHAVISWPRLKYTMVAYRSFAPFPPLLSRFDLSGAQMWSLWAMEHVCLGESADSEYLRKLAAQGGLPLLEAIREHAESLPSAASIASRILVAAASKKLLPL